MARAPGPHDFLSDAWVEAVVEIRDRCAGELAPPPVVLRANVVVTGVPFGEGQVHGYVDTSRGLMVEPGRLDDPDFTAELDYDTARALFIDQDPRSLMEAIVTGRIRLTGDASALLEVSMAPAAGDDTEPDLASEVARRVREVTR